MLWNIKLHLSMGKHSAMIFILFSPEQMLWNFIQIVIYIKCQNLFPGKKM